jgi:hypothetical protein
LDFFFASFFLASGFRASSLTGAALLPEPFTILARFSSRFSFREIFLSSPFIPSHPYKGLAGFPMRLGSFAETAIFAQLQPIRIVLFVLRGMVVTLFAFRAS